MATSEPQTAGALGGASADSNQAAPVEASDSTEAKHYHTA